MSKPSAPVHTQSKKHTFSNPSRVKLAHVEESNEHFAVKILKRDNPYMTKKFLDLVLTEVHTMKGLNHPNIVNLIEYGDNGEVEKNGRMEKVLYIVLELALGGELFDYVATGGRHSQLRAWTMAGGRS